MATSKKDAKQGKEAAAAAKPDGVEEEAGKSAEAAIIDESTLMKTIQRIEAEAKGEDPEPEPEAEPAVKSVEARPLADSVEEHGSQALRKSLDVSGVLREFVDVFGAHVDAVLGEFAKSLTNQNGYALALVGAIEGLQKRVTELAAKVEEYGGTPGTPPSAKAPGTQKSEALEKSAGTQPEDAKPELGKRHVLVGLESLVKNATNDEDRARFSDALVKFDSTGDISNPNLARAVKEFRRVEAAE